MINKRMMLSCLLVYFTTVLLHATIASIWILMNHSIKIEFLQPSMLDAYATHLQQHMNESGSDGLIYCPFNNSFKHQHDEIFANVTKRLAEPLDALKWQRAFVLVEGDKIVGHLDLQGRG